MKKDLLDELFYFEFILGSDVGNSYTKTSEGIRFKSLVSKRHKKAFVKNSYDIEFDEKKFKVGDDAGSYFTGPSKYYTDQYKAALITSIVRSAIKVQTLARNIVVDLVLGTPVMQYDDTKDDCVKSALAIKNQHVILDNIEYVVTVRDVIVAPQSSIIKSGISSAIIIDFGGGTLDTAKWIIDGENFYMSESDCYTFDEFGFDSVIKKLITTITSKYSIYKIRKISYDDMVIALITKKITNINGEINISKLVEDTLTEYISQIKAELDFHNFDLNADVLYLIGGCASVLRPYFIKVFEIDKKIADKFVLVEKNPQFANALSYKTIGNAKFIKNTVNNIIDEEVVATESVGE